ncbi:MULTISPECIES: GntR family transcriptional regulator [unclassified Mycobacterium]|uniref:GntR family transcriptional regulator n=1 Tax=unclassified Mycobacterium TaxID=2642494 RepID=UPI0029C635D3|nr:MULTISPECIES: GntR family transcriptional regulator [unclassified Mycobacterium]
MGGPNDGAPLVSAAAGVPLHRQLFLVLHDEIVRGALDQGDPLPTEQTLCDQFGVSRITVRRALADLAAVGLIERRHGVGSFVLEAPATGQRDVGGSYLDEMRQVEFETEVEVLEFGVRAVPRPVAEQLRSDDRALHALRLRRARRTGEPLMTTETWLPVALAETITRDALVASPLYRLLAEAGVALGRLDHEFTAELAGPRSAQLLGTAIGAPLIRVNRVAFADGEPHHVMSMVLSPSRSRVVLNQSAAEVESSTGLAIAHDVRRPIA